MTSFLHPPHLVDIVVKLLLYADELALMSETPQGLQKQIDVLSEFCVERQLVFCFVLALMKMETSHYGDKYKSWS